MLFFSFHDLSFEFGNPRFQNERKRFGLSSYIYICFRLWHQINLGSTLFMKAALNTKDWLSSNYTFNFILYSFNAVVNEADLIWLLSAFFGFYEVSVLHGPWKFL